ncbi:TIGR00730 family Rossman fold protein [Saliniramus sp.]|uniref:LOG family protein n=1 Tax=Saliniramus sp. TaxID=2986772 RepID=UPI002B9A6F41|nr:TIGR00730 family Rossman fold protein [Saliniramus sp.]HMB09190.1 TIGR00730 family Rossman fold protein [Saliniramus sp.]
MNTIRSICVYCGSGSGSDPAFAEAAKALGRAMAAENIGLVYGGGAVGLMGTVARAVLDHGGHVTGIIPDFLMDKERTLSDVQDTIVVSDMHTRKQMMFEKADAFVALPGGIGTLEELVEQMTWAQLGRHRKPILMFSVADFYKPLLVLLAHMRQSGFIRAGMELNYLVAEHPDDVIGMLRDAARRRGEGDAHDESLIESRF